MIKKLVIKNYKSLRYVEVPLRPFIIFVGPNNAGKSNILDCLKFIQDLVNYGPGAVNGRGGFGTCVWNGDYRETISFELHGQGSRSYEKGAPSSGFSKRIEYIYYLELTGRPDGSYSISQERFGASVPELSKPGAGGWIDDHERQLLKAGPEGRMLLVSQQAGAAQVLDLEGNLKFGAGTGGQQPVLSNLRTVDTAGYPIIGHFCRDLLRWGFYDPIPAHMITATQVKKDLLLGMHGDNVSGILHTIYAENPDLFSNIQETLHSGVPEIEQLFTSLTEQGGTYATIKEKSLQVRIPIWAMSKGTLRLLAYLAVLFSPQVPPLICFEEPENFIHARLADFLANILKRASRQSQLLITSHSPYLVNALKPEDLLVVEKTDGQTTVRTVSDQAGVQEALKLIGLGELWYSGDIGGVP